VEHHAASFRRAARNEALADAVKADVHTAPLSGRERALVRYAERLTREPRGFPASALEPLRAVGLADEEILSLTEITAYFNFVNRMAEGLGVELEDD
jgi:uncharacterized peroxidase-related enzyme